MKNYLAKILLSIVISALGVKNVFSQGTFVNLDFENPVLPLNPVNFFVPTANAIPGWTAYTYGISQSEIVFNTVSLGSAAVSLQGPGSVQPIPHGNYFVILQGSSASTPGSAAIGQTGQIPANAQSLTFWGFAAQGAVTFNGQTLQLETLSTTANYDIYGADISAYAGETGQLLFTAQPNIEAYVDNIQFSTSQVPEPSTWALMLCGAGLFGLIRRNHKI